MILGGNTGVGGSPIPAGAGGGAPEETVVDWYIDQVRTAGGACLPVELPVSADGTPSCKLFAASSSAAACDCAAQGRAPVNAEITKSVVASLASVGSCDYMGAPACSSFCVCEVLEATGASYQDCLNSAAPASTTSGWCYVAPAAGIGSSSLVASCPTTWKQTLRFLGNAQPTPAEVFSLACGGAKPATARAPQAASAELGSACVSSSEYDPAFGGFALNNVDVDLGSRACRSSVCLQNHFQGRASCPYGQLQSAGPGGCLVPGTSTPVTAEQVPAQYVARSPSVASICSCRCAGSGPGPFCSCPAGMQCADLIGEMGLPDEAEYAGSYCVPDGSVFSATTLQTTRCDISSMTCGAPNQ